MMAKAKYRHMGGLLILIYAFQKVICVFMAYPLHTLFRFSAKRFYQTLSLAIAVYSAYRAIALICPPIFKTLLLDSKKPIVVLAIINHPFKSNA